MTDSRTSNTSNDLTEIDGEKFNLPAIFKRIGDLESDCYGGSERNFVAIVRRLIVSLVNERMNLLKRLSDETDPVATDPCRVALAIGLLETFRDGRINSLNSTHESILGSRAQLESERDVFGYAIDALRTLNRRYGAAQKAADDRIRRPTGQCSWGCYYSEDGKLVRDSACTVHGASSENG